MARHTDLHPVGGRMAVYLRALACENGVLSTEDKRAGSVSLGCFGLLPVRKEHAQRRMRAR